MVRAPVRLQQATDDVALADAGETGGGEIGEEECGDGDTGEDAPGRSSSAQLMSSDRSLRVTLPSLVRAFLSNGKSSFCRAWLGFRVTPCFASTPGATTCSAARFRRRFWAAISALIGLGARAEHAAAPESGLGPRKRFELCKRNQNGRVSHSRGVAQKLNLWPQTRGTVVASTCPTDWCAQKRLVLPQQTRCALPVAF